MRAAKALGQIVTELWKFNCLLCGKSPIFVSYCHISNSSNPLSICTTTWLSSHWISMFCIYFKETSAFLPSKGLYVFLNNAEIIMKIEFYYFPLCCAFLFASEKNDYVSGTIRAHIYSFPYFVLGCLWTQSFIAFSSEACNIKATSVLLSLVS